MRACVGAESAGGVERDPSAGRARCAGVPAGDLRTFDTREICRGNEGSPGMNYGKRGSGSRTASPSGGGSPLRSLARGLRTHLTPQRASTELGGVLYERSPPGEVATAEEPELPTGLARGPSGTPVYRTDRR